jgi:hypothetical protein
MSETINLIFPDGAIVTGNTFRELEDALRASQWNTYMSRPHFRVDMPHRAAMWSGRRGKLVVRQTSKQFIYHLVHSGMCLIEIIPTTPQESA